MWQPTIICHFSSLGLHPTWSSFDVPDPLPTSDGNGNGAVDPTAPSGKNAAVWLMIDALIFAHAGVVDLYRREYKPEQGGRIGITLVSGFGGIGGGEGPGR